MAQGVPGRLRPRIFLTFRHYKGGRLWAKRTGCLYPRRSPWYSLAEAESTSRHMVLSGKPRKKSPVTPPGIGPGNVRLVAQCLNHYATSDLPPHEYVTGQKGTSNVQFFSLLLTTIFGILRETWFGDFHKKSWSNCDFQSCWSTRKITFYKAIN